MAQGHDEQSASAICTKSLQDAGEDIYVEASAERRTIVLRGAAGKLRIAEMQGREHMVIPVTALLEAVIWPVNAPTPEYIPYETLSSNLQAWDGRPVVLRHPIEGAEHVGANTPKVLSAQGIGTIFKTRIEDRQLKMEAWLDTSRADHVKDLPATLKALQKGDTVEVSVGVFATLEKRKGRFNGRDYGAIWREMSPDHLALLPDGDKGACSIAMGCGARALAAHPLPHAAYKIDVLEPDLTWTPPKNTFDLATLRTCVIKKEGDKFVLYSKDGSKKLGTFDTEEEAKKREQQVEFFKHRSAEEVKGRREALQLKATRTLQDDAKTYTLDTMSELLDQAGDSWDYLTEMLDELKTADASLPSYQAMLESLRAFMSAMMGTLGAASSVAYCLSYPKDAASVPGVRAMAGARNSKNDQAMLQSMHDMVVKLGASCETLRETQARTNVRHEGGRWVIYSKDGLSRLATHSTREEAEAQATAIELVLQRRSQQRGDAAAHNGRCKCGGEGATR